MGLSLLFRFIYHFFGNPIPTVTRKSFDSIEDLINDFGERVVYLESTNKY